MQANQILAYTKSVAGRIAAAEFMNEPTYAAMGGAPKGYNAADYSRDIALSLEGQTNIGKIQISSASALKATRCRAYKRASV